MTPYRRLERDRRRLADLRSQAQRNEGRNSRALQDDIILALARNRCGAAYAQQARRIDNANNPFSSFFQDEGGSYEGPGNTYRGLPFATYRTLCVRTCDGYYFPISFSTLPNYFQRDAKACQDRCAAPAQLYYHQNPGGSIEQMVSIADNTTYKQLATAFQYRKQFKKGCSCKASEYIPEGVVSAAPPATAETADRRRPKFSPVR